MLIVLECVHASGRYNAPVKDTVRYVLALDAEKPFDICTLTEGHRPGLVPALRAALPHHRVVKSGAFLWIWRPSPKLRRMKRIARRRTITKVKGFPAWRQTRLGVLWFYVPASKKRLRSMVSHLPAGVEYGNRWRVGGEMTRLAIKAHRAATSKLRVILRETPSAVRILHMDTNVDYRRPDWRTYMRQELAAPDIWGTTPPHRGSHGSRLIDVSHVVAGKVLHSWVSKVDKPDSLDHRAVRYTLAV